MRGAIPRKDRFAAIPQPLIDSVSPDPMPGNTESVVLIVNGSALQTTFMDSDHLRATITQQTFDSFGGSVGSSVQIAVRSQGFVPVCSSATLVLVIN